MATWEVHRIQVVRYERRASIISSKNMRGRSEIILLSEYVIRVVIIDRQPRFFELLFFRYGVEYNPSKHQLKIKVLHFLFRIRQFRKNWIILIYYSPYGNFVEAGNSQSPLFWVLTTSQVELKL